MHKVSMKLLHLITSYQAWHLAVTVWHWTSSLAYDFECWSIDNVVETDKCSTTCISAHGVTSMDHWMMIYILLIVGIAIRGYCTLYHENEALLKWAHAWESYENSLFPEGIYCVVNSTLWQEATRDAESKPQWKSLIRNKERERLSFDVIKQQMYSSKSRYQQSTNTTI